ncbi:hypothetical protein D8674_000939 [Pyrus ussuriensis x Pyrus communis]|uniref:Uncharacterized protein n=1 Tax=Pyrus ussuriensis x Pyrus communis TaxID=2448454 RepID=A0A5N5F4M7_9ROSA|nr:hypothetical protein D8674_000939 [Pyrus ussuriensis x Pyrus communis]
MHAEAERDLGTMIDSESLVSSCDDLSNPMEEDMEDVEVVEREEVAKQQRAAGEDGGVLKVQGILGRKI